MVISYEDIWQNEVACIRPYLSEFFRISFFLGGQLAGEKGLQLGSSVAGSRGVRICSNICKLIFVT